MKKQLDQKIVFLNSYLPRAGHNFTSEALKVFTDHHVLIHNRSETRLATVLNEYFKISNKMVFHKSDKDFLDHLFIKGLRHRILEKSDSKYVMIKDTSFVGVDHLQQLFPSDIHLILLRDPENLFNSLIKGMRLKKNNLRDFIKKAGIVFGIYPYYYSKKLSNQILKVLPNFENSIVLKFEDLVGLREETLEMLKSLFDSDKEVKTIKEEIDSIKVINSSFTKEMGTSHIWQEKPKSERFDPVNRKGNSYLIRLGIRCGSRKLRKKLNYI